MSFLTGSAPKASFSTQPTILPQQQQLLTDLQGLLESGQTPAGVQAYGGNYSAPLQPLQQTSLAGLEQQALAVPGQQTPQQSGTVNTASNTLTNALNFQPPQIDATQAFKTGVVDPLTTNFNTNVLPGIAGHYGAGAGGAFSSDAFKARDKASTDFNNTLASAGSTFAYNAASTNQSADLTGNQQRIAALGQTPGIAGLSANLQGIDIANLLATLQGGAVPYQQAQTQVVGQYQDFLNQLNQKQALLGDFSGSSLAPTLQTLGVGTGGSSGLLQGLLGNTGLGTAAGTAIFSDERLKEDLEQVGEVEGLPIYKYKYKGDPARKERVGVLAQDAEKRVPAAVVRLDDKRGTRLVNYSALLEGLLKEAA